MALSIKLGDLVVDYTVSVVDRCGFPASVARACISVLLCFCAISPPAYAEWYYDEQSIMGTRISLQFWYAQPAADSAAPAETDTRDMPALIIRSVMDEMRRIDTTLSTYKPSSDLSQLNLKAASGPQSVSEELAFLIDKSLYFGRLSEGAFDITYASVGRYYDYRQKKRPSDKAREALLEAIDYRHVVLDKQHQTVTYSGPDVYIDLGGIAKGHAVDRAAAILSSYGVNSATVSAGGDSRVIGDKRGRPFMIGIKNPRAKAGDSDTLIRMPLENTAISTSGDYERFFIDEKSGERVHHILNPKTGSSAKGVVSVTVLGNRGVDTDPLSTTVFVLGVEKGLALINRLREFDCVIIDRYGKAHYSSGLLDPSAAR